MEKVAEVTSIAICDVVRSCESIVTLMNSFVIKFRRVNEIFSEVINIWSRGCVSREKIIWSCIETVTVIGTVGAAETGGV